MNWTRLANCMSRPVIWELHVTIIYIHAHLRRCLYAACAPTTTFPISSIDYSADCWCPVADDAAPSRGIQCIRANSVDVKADEQPGSSI